MEPAAAELRAELGTRCALARERSAHVQLAAHADQPNLKQDSSTVINDQILIKITKKSDSEESPTPEGVHQQDGTEVSSITMIERKGIQVARATRRLPRTGAPHASPATHRTWTRTVQRVAAWPLTSHSTTRLPCREGA